MHIRFGEFDGKMASMIEHVWVNATVILMELANTLRIGNFATAIF